MAETWRTSRTKNWRKRTRKKKLRNAKAIQLFFETISCSRAMHWIFQAIHEHVDSLWNKITEVKVGGSRSRIPRKRSKRMSILAAAIQRRGSFRSLDSTTLAYLKLAGPTRIIKARLSSDKSENDKQKSQTHRRGSPAWLNLSSDEACRHHDCYWRNLTPRLLRLLMPVLHASFQVYAMRNPTKRTSVPKPPKPLHHNVRSWNNFSHSEYDLNVKFTVHWRCPCIAVLHEI